MAPPRHRCRHARLRVRPLRRAHRGAQHLRSPAAGRRTRPEDARAAVPAQRQPGRRAAAPVARRFLRARDADGERAACAGRRAARRGQPDAAAGSAGVLCAVRRAGGRHRQPGERLPGGRAHRAHPARRAHQGADHARARAGLRHLGEGDAHPRRAARPEGHPRGRRDGRPAARGRARLRCARRGAARRHAGQRAPDRGRRRRGVLPHRGHHRPAATGAAHARQPGLPGLGHGADVPHPARLHAADGPAAVPRRRRAHAGAAAAERRRHAGGAVGAGLAQQGAMPNIWRLVERYRPELLGGRADGARRRAERAHRGPRGLQHPQGHRRRLRHPRAGGRRLQAPLRPADARDLRHDRSIELPHDLLPRAAGVPGLGRASAAVQPRARGGGRRQGQVPARLPARTRSAS